MNYRICNLSPCRLKADIRLKWHYGVEDTIYDYVYCSRHGKVFARSIVDSYNETMITHRPL